VVKNKENNEFIQKRAFTIPQSNPYRLMAEDAWTIASLLESTPSVERRSPLVGTVHAAIGATRDSAYHACFHHTTIKSLPSPDGYQAIGATRDSAYHAFIVPSTRR